LEATLTKPVSRSDQERTIAYLVKGWPRLSETFILNEVIAIERRNISLRIFSIKDPNDEPVHAKVAGVRASITYISLGAHWKAALVANIRLLCRRPVPYIRTLLYAILQATIHFRLAVLRRFLQAGYLGDIFLREPVSHLHAHFATSPAMVAFFTHKLLSMPYTFTAHAKDIYVSPQKLLGAKIDAAGSVITCTEYNRQYLLSQFGPSLNRKLRCIHHGLDLSEFEFRSPRARTEGIPLVLAVARLVEKKGLGHLLSAVSILRLRGRRIRVEIIGDGPLRRALETHLLGLGLEDSVKLLGAQPHEMVRLAYRRASLFVLPCTVAENGDRDGIPNVLLEAMASGVPVVSTEVSGVPELIESERDGLLVSPNNPTLLADAMERVLASTEFGERLARAARAKIEAQFSLDHGTTELLATFQHGITEEKWLARAAPIGTAVTAGRSDEDPVSLRG
jgi:glycosyltransferase involved in cell wall biosynthesis